MAQGTLRQRSKIRKDSWSFQVYLGVDPSTGKKRYHSESVKGTKSQAQRRMTEVQHKVNTGTYTEPTRLTVSEYLAQWMRDYAESHVSQRTLEGYQGNLDRYIRPRIGTIPLEKLSARHVQEMESALLREGGRNGRPLSPKTVLQVHRILSKALKEAKKLGILGRNVAEAVDPPRTTDHEARTLTWEEVSKLLQHVEDPQYRTLFLLDIQSGLRRSELLGLQWRDIDFQNQAVSVRRCWVKLPSGRKILSVPKSGQSRVVNLPPQSIDALRSHRESQEEFSGNGNFVFCRSDGNPLDPDQVTKKFKQVATSAGFGDMRLHDIRHTHATLMLGENVNLKVTSERLGHSTIAITANLYSHVQPTVQEEAAQRFGDAWSGIEALEDSRNGKRNGKLG